AAPGGLGSHAGGRRHTLPDRGAGDKRGRIVLLVVGARHDPVTPRDSNCASVASEAAWRCVKQDVETARRVLANPPRTLKTPAPLPNPPPPRTASSSASSMIAAARLSVFRRTWIFSWAAQYFSRAVAGLPGR